MNYIIGMDGGGTKTQVVLADWNGNILTDLRYGSTNPNAVPAKELTRIFQQIFRDIEERVPNCLRQVASVFAGIAGAGTKEATSQITNLMIPYFSSETKVKVVPDSINALYSGTYGKPGMVQISGTGSITYGINQKKEQGRVGGWGFLLGDEGSGFDIGRRGIMAALHYVDGLAPRTMLVEMLLDFYQVHTGRELIDKIYHAESPRIEISQVSKLVFEAFEKQDSVAIEIMRSAAEAIGKNIIALDQKLFKDVEKVDVILCGGLFTDKEILPVLLEDALYHYPKRLSLIKPELPPVAGSVIGAFMEKNIQIPSKAEENIRTYFGDEH